MLWDAQLSFMQCTPVVSKICMMHMFNEFLFDRSLSLMTSIGERGFIGRCPNSTGVTWEVFIINSSRKHSSDPVALSSSSPSPLLCCCSVAAVMATVIASSPSSLRRRRRFVAIIALSLCCHCRHTSYIVLQRTPAPHILHK